MVSGRPQRPLRDAFSVEQHRRKLTEAAQWQAAKVETDQPRGSTPITDPATGPWHPAGWLPLLVIVAPYFLNKLVYIAFPGFTVFAITDYADRLLTLGALYLVVRHASLPIPWRFTWPSAGGWGVVLLGAAILVLADVLTQPMMSWLDAHGLALTHYPSASAPAMMVFDNTVGMALVGVSEEAVFRFYLINALLLRGLKIGGAIVLSTIVFALIHWSYGLGALAFSALAGLALALIYVGARNLAVPVLVHALYDSVFFFGGVAALRRLLFE